MIRSFRHKGLRLLFEDDERRGIPPERADRIGRIIVLLNRATGPDDMNLPGYRLHALKGDLAGFWTVSVSGNWRIVWRFEEGDVADVDMVDYH